MYEITFLNLYNFPIKGFLCCIFSTFLSYYVNHIKIGPRFMKRDVEYLQRICFSCTLYTVQNRHIKYIQLLPLLDILSDYNDYKDKRKLLNSHKNNK